MEYLFYVLLRAAFLAKQIRILCPAQAGFFCFGAKRRINPQARGIKLKY
jgi:hypothetical protein